MRIITLQRPAICAGCGKEIPTGARARYYSQDKIYCESHDKETGLFSEPSPQGLGLPVTREEIIDFIGGLESLLAGLKARLRK